MRLALKTIRGILATGMLIRRVGRGANAHKKGVSGGCHSGNFCGLRRKSVGCCASHPPRRVNARAWPRALVGPATRAPCQRPLPLVRGGPGRVTPPRDLPIGRDSSTHPTWHLLHFPSLLCFPLLKGLPVEYCHFFLGCKWKLAFLKYFVHVISTVVESTVYNIMHRF